MTKAKTKSNAKATAAAGNDAAPPLRLEWRDPADLAANPHNWRTHPQHQVDSLRDVISQVGWAGAALFNERTGRLIDGHCRQKLGIEQGGKIPVLIGSWSEAQEMLILATFDPIAGEAEADAAKLDEVLRAVSDGGSEAIAALIDGLARDNGIVPGDGSGEVSEDDVPEPPKEAVTRPGDLWVLGDPDSGHRLLCGDSTKAEDVKRLMGGERADMMFADPLYGVSYDGGHFHSGDVNIKRSREKLAGDDDVGIYARFLPVCLPHVDGPCYLWFAGTRGRAVFDAVEDAGGIISAMLVWHKTNATYAAMNAQYKQRHEPCLYFKPKGSTLRWVGPSDACTLWEFDKEGINKLHPTQKPVALVANALKNHTTKTILDPFCGSGTTIAAAEALQRRVFAMELDCAYSDVILTRYQNLTNRPAILEATGQTFEQVGRERCVA